MTIDILLQKFKAGPFFNLVKYFFLVFVILLVVLLSWRSVKVSYLFFPSFIGTQSLSSALDSEASGNDSGTYLLPSAISDLKLFGKYNEDVAPAPEKEPPPPPAPKVKLVLHGLMDLGDPKLSSAILSQPGSETKVYGIGDKLPGNSKLSEIHGDRVVVSFAGTEETIWFDKNKPNAVSRKKSSEQKTKVNKKPMQSLASQYGLGGSGISQLTKSLKGKPSREDIKNYYTELSRVPPNELFNTISTEFESNPTSVVNQLGLKAQRSRGYLVTSKIPKHIVEAYNLQYGDRILEINGQKLGDPRRDKQVFANVREVGQATVKLQRGRQITTLTVPITY